MMLGYSCALLSAIAVHTVSALHGPLIQETLRADEKAYKHLDLTHDLFGFHKNLTQIESITGNEKEVGEWLTASLESQGYKVEQQAVSKDPIRFNVLAWPGEKRDADILISSHIDTVSRITKNQDKSGKLSTRGRSLPSTHTSAMTRRSPAAAAWTPKAASRRRSLLSTHYWLRSVYTQTTSLCST